MRSRTGMSNEPFAFPPPPPPPPRRANASSGNDVQFDFVNRGGARGGRGTWDSRGERGGYTARGDRARRGSYTQSSHGSGSRGSYQRSLSDSRGSGYRSSNNVSRGLPNSSRGPHPYPSISDTVQTFHPPQKRQHDTAFPATSVGQRRTQAAPAVPSFNASISSLLASSHVPSHVELQNARDKPRKHNQLGLTPSLNSVESVSDDEDEEKKLAQEALSTDLQFEYHGRTSTLKSASDIAAWIAERKKKYPTQVKADQAKKEAEERRLKREEEQTAIREAARVRREQREKNGKEEKSLRQTTSSTTVHPMRKKLLDAHRVKAATNEAEGHTGAHEDVAAKAMLKAEKLRQKAAKAQIQLAKAEMALLKAQSSSKEAMEETKNTNQITGDQYPTISLGEVVQSGSVTAEGGDWGSRLAEGASSSKDLAPPNLSVAGAENISATMRQSEMSIPDLVILSDSSELSEADTASDATSSSESSDSSDSDITGDSAPEENSSKSQGPMRVPAPKRTSLSSTRSQNICRSFLKTGRCKFGDRCHFSHDLPARNGTRRPPKEAKKTGSLRRKGLWQVMAEKEQEQEREQVLRAIVVLGEKGMLGTEPDGGR